MNFNNPQILTLLQNYKSYISNTKMQDELYKWEFIKKFKGRPDTNAPDFAAEYKAIKFGNLLYQLASAVGNHICKENPEEFRQLFVYLFDETIPLNKRVSYFNVESLKLYRSIGGELGHHQDERSISTYLTLHNPKKYTFYKSKFYKELCKLMGVAPAGKNEKYGHYLELVNQFIDNYIVPDTELTDTVKSYIPEYYDGANNLLLAQDILYCMLNKKEENNITVMENVKEAFATWLTTNPKADYFDNDKSKLVKELTTYEAYFDFPLYETSEKEYKNLIEGINEVIYADNNDFVVFSEKTSSHRPRAILGKRNYQRFLEELFNQKVTINEMMNYPLNQILYGPPGTGKTYNTINRALNIVRPHNNDITRESIKNRFNKYVSYGQIVFTTFHQSMSYEDFIEGIKPSKEGSEIQYEIQDGIFKKLANKARENFELSQIKHDDFDTAFNRLKDELDESDSNEIQIDTSRAHFTITKITERNIKFRKANGSENHDLVVSTLKEIYLKKRIMLSGLSAYYSPLIEKMRSYGYSQKTTSLENFVLIIDEINRGNISQIFGELITLIEDGKRDGQEEALSAILPYSKEPFSIPPNLYIIGTMNTADRSVEALDTALRRRFSFEEMLPQPALLKDKGEKGSGKVGKIDLEELLSTINERIEALVDRDHTIGHAFFMDVDSPDSLRNVFANKVIPLLQEYFYGDYAKMEMVIGPDFFNGEKRKKKVIFAIQNEDIEIPTGNYELMNILDPTFNFDSAINRLLNRKVIEVEAN